MGKNCDENHQVMSGKVILSTAHSSRQSPVGKKFSRWQERLRNSCFQNSCAAWVSCPRLESCEHKGYGRPQAWCGLRTIIISENQGCLGWEEKMLRKSLKGIFSHSGGTMTNKASIIASWESMVFGNGQREGATQTRTVALCDPTLLDALFCGF